MTNKKEVAQALLDALGVGMQDTSLELVSRGIAAVTLREVVVQLQYYQCCRDQDIEDMVLDARAILDVADELEGK
jgi:hypothetical protein